MAKISSEERHQYFDKLKPYRETIESIVSRERKMRVEIHKSSNGSAHKKISLSDDMLNLASLYIIISTISQSMLKVKNEDALNDARKTLYKAVIYMEEVVTDLVDAPYSEYEEKLVEIEDVTAAQRYELVRKMGLAIQLLENAYGDNTKWRWSFVDLEGRFAAVAKNIFNLKKAVGNTDPRSPDYEPTVYHLRLIKKLLMQAADRFREKYELSTNRFDDFKMGINFLQALRRINALMGDRDEAETVKKKYEIWTTKLEADMKKLEESKKA